MNVIDTQNSDSRTSGGTTFNDGTCELICAIPNASGHEYYLYNGNWIYFDYGVVQVVYAYDPRYGVQYDGLIKLILY